MRLLLLVLILVTFQAAAVAQNEATRVESLLRREMRERRIPGIQAVVVKNGKVVLSTSAGTADLQHAVPVNSNTVFPIYSCTKAFTGVAIMQLVEEGKIDLEAPISRYLNDLPDSWTPITVKQLLTHVSGLPNLLRLLDPITYGLPAGVTEEDLWKKTKSLPMISAVGERFSYNQTNYALLGKMIDRLTGKPFAEVFMERQFQIAGMQRTSFGDSRDVISNKTPTYRYVQSIDGEKLDQEKLVIDYAEFPPFRRAASGMNSSAEDLARWLIALQQGKLLKSKSALDTLWRAGSFNDGSRTLWAIGWMTRPRPKHRAVIATGGSRAALIVYPDDDLAIVVLTNLMGAFSVEFIDELAGIYNSEIATSDPVTA